MKQHCIVSLHYKPRSGMYPTASLLHTRCCVLSGMTKGTRSTGALQRSGPADMHNMALIESGGAVEFVNWVVNLAQMACYPLRHEQVSAARICLACCHDCRECSLVDLRIALLHVLSSATPSCLSMLLGRGR